MTQTMAPDGIALVVLFAFLGGEIHASEYVVTKCFKGTESEPSGDVTLACPEGHVIVVDEAIFGRNQYLACMIADGDCIEKTRTFHTCEGKRLCQKNFKTYSANCGYSTVLELGYTCVQAYHTPMPRTSPPSTSEGSQEQGHEEGQGQGRFDTTPLHSQPKSVQNDGDSEEIGLIVGCVIATIVTVFALIVAIIMVIRRLFQYDRKDRPRIHPSNQPMNCMDSFCLKLDRVPCFATSGPDEESLDMRNSKTPEKAVDKVDRKTDPLEKPANKEQKGNSSLTLSCVSSNSSPRAARSTRMAPVGQESVDNHNSTSTTVNDPSPSTGSRTSTAASNGQPQPPLHSTKKMRNDRILNEGRNSPNAGQDSAQMNCSQHSRHPVSFHESPPPTAAANNSEAPRNDGSSSLGTSHSNIETEKEDHSKRNLAIYSRSHNKLSKKYFDENIPVGQDTHDRSHCNPTESGYHQGNVLPDKVTNPPHNFDASEDFWNVDAKSNIAQEVPDKPARNARPKFEAVAVSGTESSSLC